MGYPLLPVSLPGFILRSNWNAHPSDPNRRTEMDDGSMAVVRKLNRIRGFQSVTWTLSAAQYDVAVDFWARDLDAGSKWFMVPFVEGMRNRLQVCRFMGGEQPWRASSPANGVFHLSFELEARALPQLTLTERMAVDLYLELAGDTDDIVARMAAINVDLAGLSPWF